MTRSPGSLQAAFDAARFGEARTLNLREGLPLAADAVTQAETWLRAKQASGAGEVLVITGRGAGSPDGVAAIRPAIAKLLNRLRRLGVVAAYAEHTAGSFVVTLAPLSAFLAAGRRRRTPATPMVAASDIAGIDEECQQLLRKIAEQRLIGLGVQAAPPALVRDEIERVFSRLSSVDAPLRDVLARMLAELTDDA